MIHVQTFLQKSTLRFSDVVNHIHANQSPATHVFVTLFKQSICLNRLNAPKIETFIYT